MLRAGETSDGVIDLTSPDPLRRVGLPIRRQVMISLAQTRKEVQNDKMIIDRVIVAIGFVNSTLF